MKPSDEHVIILEYLKRSKFYISGQKGGTFIASQIFFFVNSQDSEFVKLGFEILPQKFKSLILVFSVSGQKGGTFGTSQKSAIRRHVPITQNQ